MARSRWRPRTEFASFLDSCAVDGEIVSFGKNFLSVGFKLDYVMADGSMSNYIPDFVVKVDAKTIVIVETKGLEEIDLPQKMRRLKQWCDDLNWLKTGTSYRFVFVDEAGYKKYKVKSFHELLKSFVQYQ